MGILPKVRWRLLVAIALVVAGAGCDIGRRSDPVVNPERRSPVDLPDHFLVGSSDGSAAREPVAGSACRSPMQDPRDGASLVLVRSRSGMGDYEVPEGRYGVRQKELLRLDCATGRATGIVPR